MILIGPPPLPSGTSFPILFHFGGEDGHCCDRAQFDWYVNDKFVSFLDFNNGADCRNVFQGPFTIDPTKYDSNRCASLVFSFIAKAACVLDGTCEPHDGASIDVTAWNKSIVTHFISTIEPTEFTICELMTGSGSTGTGEEPPPP